MSDEERLILQMWHQGKSKNEIQMFVYYQHKKVKENRITKTKANLIVEQTIYEDYMKNIAI